ncbi:hypothetical protein ACT1UH_01850 [Mycoplasma sp. 332]|uniref:hypothetical protein n=1 Tax=Mycoplasma sp. 332 TaxID=3458236 RepID=UPI00403695C1
MHEQPKEINDWLTLNDYEMDIIYRNIKSKKVILTLINRLTKNLMQSYQDSMLEQ